MSKATELMAMGLAPELAKQVGAFSLASVTAAGSAITDATLIGTQVAYLATAASAGVKLPDYPIGEFVFVFNRSGNSQSVYPHSASGTFEGGGAGSAQTVNSAANALFVRRTATDWIYCAIS